MSAPRLELTGTALVQDVPTALSYLHTFPVSVVEIDSSFVQTLGRKTRRASLVAVIQPMAGDLGSRTVAEGVETAEQEGLLRVLGCDVALGELPGHGARRRPAGPDPQQGG